MRTAAESSSGRRETQSAEAVLMAKRCSHGQFLINGCLVCSQGLLNGLLESIVGKVVFPNNASVAADDGHGRNSFDVESLERFVGSQANGPRNTMLLDKIGDRLSRQIVFCCQSDELNATVSILQIGLDQTCCLGGTRASP